MNLDLKDNKELLLIVLISAILTGYYINFNVNLGVYCSDVYVYLLNALYYTGININSTKSIYLSPVICFLTSILFKVIGTDKIAILIVTGIFAILGNIGLYLLFKTRFDKLLSLAGTILFATFAINLTWLANGSIDIPAVAISIWIILIAHLAIKKNPKYYIGLFSLLVIGFFTRYTVVLLVPVIGLYYLYENSFSLNKNDLKYLLIGIVLGIITTLIILIPISLMGHGHLGFIGQIGGGITGNHGSIKDLAYNPDITYYLFNFLNFISSSNTVFINRTPALETPTVLSILISAIMVIGAILWAKKNEFNFDLKKTAGIVLCFIALITFNQFSSFITIILVFLGLLLIGQNSSNKNGLLMLSWFLVNFIFFSYFSIKVNRYIIPAIPAFVYFVMASVELINEKINKQNILPILLIVLFLIQGFLFPLTFEDTQQFIAPEKMVDYVTSNIDGWEDIEIGVYQIRIYNWYLGKNITGISSNNTAQIENSNLTYYISDIPQNLTNYAEIKNIDNLYLYERISN